MSETYFKEAKNSIHLTYLFLLIKKTGCKCHKPYNRALVFFFFPEEQPLLMEEMKPLSEWIESIPGELMIKWGMGLHSTPKVRAIVALKTLLNG